ncbi:hypothetical protein E2C01_066785 [Portunus trituberculatus]|uniref:Uncharacterized protein n=1 Tax=Portunus trituberculatus TaxID=210409 RepID=A0A5B7HRL7_PORTR|nr:hypothetical protein [Portunus trituberculatus]
MSALEMEAFLCASVSVPAVWSPQKAFPTREFWACKPARTPGAPCHLRCHYALASIVKVWRTVDDQPCQLMVGTGAKRMFVRPKLVSACHLPETTQWLHGVTGHYMTFQGPVSMRMDV